MDHRVGWLLATTRILHPDDALRQCTAFCALALERGVRVDRSRISRWENGATPTGWDTIELYEALLDRPPGSLVTVADGVRREFGDALPRTHRGGDASGRGADELLDSALGGGELTGPQWQELTRRLVAYDSLYLRRDDWDTLSARLIAELGRGAGTAYVRRFEAASRLIRHPSAQRHLSRALGRYVMDPDTQIVLPVLRLLTEVDDIAASTLVLRMVSEDDAPLREAAASVAAVKLRQGVLPQSELRQLEAYAAATLRRTEMLDRGLDALDVVMQLPLQSFQRVLSQIPDRRVQEQLGRSRSTGELVIPRQAAMLVADLAAAVQADETDFARHQEPDLMLRRLLREALFHVHKSRRHQAALLLAASPYRRPVSRQLQGVTSGTHSFLAARAWTVLMRVGHAGRRSDLLLAARSEPRATLRARALVNVGLDDAPLSIGEAEALVATTSMTERESVRHGMFFALGMSGSALLAELAEHESESIRRPARWWHAQGPAIHEP